MISPYAHVSFDLDGTLVHTLPEYRYSIIPVVLSKLGGRRPEAGAMDAFWFEGNRSKTIEERFGVNPDTFWECFHAHDTPEARGSHAFAYQDAVSSIDSLDELFG